MISFFSALILFGGFYDWSVAFIAILMIAEIFWHYRKGKPIFRREKNYFLLIPVILFLWMILVSFWSVDYAENLLGVLRGAALLLFLYLSFQMEEEEKERIFTLLPYFAVGMTVIGLLSLLHENAMSYFWKAGRFGGFFQYANTCALFLLIAIILLIDRLFQVPGKGRKKVIDITAVGILFVGIMLTGSRSVFILLLFFGIYRCITNKKLRIPFAVTISGFLAIAYGYMMIAGDRQNIARIFTIFSSNSTLFGRILYDLDAISILLSHPFGLGYMGYYYIQPSVQTGVYTTRFVHNDLLQAGVDYGVVAIILILIYLGYQIIKGNQDKRKKEILIMILAASLVDFHLQYLGMLMLLLLCCDLGEKKDTKKKKELRENYIFLTGAGLFFLYISIACFAHYRGNNDRALLLFPDYTEAQIEKMISAEGKEEATGLADSILSHNRYVADAHRIKAYVALMDGDYISATEEMDQAVSLKKYDITIYQEYDGLLDNMIALCENINDIQGEEKLLQKKEELPERLRALEETTSPIAFKLRDKPKFTW